MPKYTGLACCFVLLATPLVHAAEFTVQSTAADLKAFRAADPKRPVLDMRQVALADWKKLSQDADTKITASYDFQVLSLVGPVLSIEEDDYCDCGGAHPTAGKLFRAIDLKQSHASEAVPAQITSLFPAESVLKALLADSVVKKVLPAGKKPELLDALVKALAMKTVQVGECDYYFPEELLSRFAVFDVKGTQAAVRFSLSHESEICRGQMTQIGVELPIPAALQVALEQGQLMRHHSAVTTAVEFSK